MTSPIAGSSGMGAVLDRIAALESRFATMATASTPAAPGAATDRTDNSFATSLAQASGGGPPSTLPAGTGSGTVAVPGAGAGAVRGIAALAGGAPVSAPQGTSAAPPTTSGDLGARAVEVAEQFLGVPYRWGGTSPSGFDCSGLVQYAYRQLGVDLPRVSRDQARAGQPVASLADARPGDLVAFGSPVDHIGIYAGNGKMVVAPHTGAHVRVQEITRPIVAIRRVV